MLDVLTRASRHPIAYSGFFRTTDLRFRERIQESESIYSFIFEADSLPKWRAGQHSVFTLPDQKVSGKTWRPFSVASAPHEGVIRIGTIVPETPSNFKQKLMGLAAGDTVRMHGPYGEFFLKPHMKNIVGVAGGIGITPFRSIISDLAHNKSDTKVTLIYSAKDDLYTYKSDLENWQNQNPNIKIVYTKTAEEVNAELSVLASNHQNNAHYFLSGSPGMIGALRKNLLNKGIRKIVNDPFKGY